MYKARTAEFHFTESVMHWEI